MAKHLCSTKRQRSQWGEGSGRRSEYGEVRGTCPIQERVSVIHGSDTHHAYRPTEVDVSEKWLVSFFTFRAPHREQDCDWGLCSDTWHVKIVMGSALGRQL